MSAVDIATVLPRRRERVVLPRLVLAIVLWTVGGFAFAVCLSVTAPFFFGIKSLTVLSGSMEPTIHVGDVVVVKQISPLDARVGDVITFRDPTDPKRLITHRVRSIHVADGAISFQTKGDANTSVERWNLSTRGTIGRVLYRIPRIGYVLFWVRGPLGRVLLVVLPALLLGVYELWRIWAPSPKRGDVDGS